MLKETDLRIGNNKRIRHNIKSDAGMKPNERFLLAIMIGAIVVVGIFILTTFFTD